MEIERYSYLGIQVCRVGELFHNHMAKMMKQRVFVDGVLDFRYFGEVLQLESLDLRKGKKVLRRGEREEL